MTKSVASNADNVQNFELKGEELECLRIEKSRIDAMNLDEEVIALNAGDKKVNTLRIMVKIRSHIKSATGDAESCHRSQK